MPERLPLYPEIEPFRTGRLPVGGGMKSILRNRAIRMVSQPCFYMADPAAALNRPSGDSSIPAIIGSSFLISAAADVPRPMPTWKITPPGIWLAISRH